jgi:hypothetical protein
MNYSQNHCFFDYIEQRPIFHIYFQEQYQINQNLYKSVMIHIEY